MKDATILAVQPYDLHGVRWYRIAYAMADAPDRVLEARIAHDVITGEPLAGGKVRIRTLLGIIDRIEIREP